MNSYESLQDAFSALLQDVLSNGVLRHARGSASHELFGACFRINNPRRRLILVPRRKWSLFYAIGDLLWNLAGSDDLSHITYYSRKWKRFSDDGVHVSGTCYGQRVFSRLHAGRSQWETCLALLGKDPHSRRAVLSIRSPEDSIDVMTTLDSACCCSIQLIMDDGRLNMITYMRSNDLYLGFGYDVFLFTMLQELFAGVLDVELGWYQHIAGSLHIYEKDICEAELLAAEGFEDSTTSMCRMTSVDQLDSVLRYEKAIRQSPLVSADMEFDVDPYWCALLQVLLYVRLKRDSRVQELDLRTPILAEDLLHSFPWLL